MPIKHVSTHSRHPVKIWTDDITDKARAQLKNLAELPFIHKHVAAMADVHLGVGATIGSVIATHKAIIPAAVGVDIGCGMNALRLSLKSHQLPDNLKTVRNTIEKLVPLGPGAAHKTQNPIQTYDLMAIHKKHPVFSKNPILKASTQLGTLGGGNHFIEICIDEEEHIWVMLHSGSRGIGNQIGTYFINKAKEQMEKWHIKLPDNNLAYLPFKTELFDDYMFAVYWAQEYALNNRRLIMANVLKALTATMPEFDIINEGVSCHHNYVAIENHFGENVYITRKGAIRARSGDLGIIPGSMGTKSFIVRGKGNKDSFCSCSHGAGRTMSRTEARKRFTAADLAAQTKGIECPKDDACVDEIPAAYKDIDKVMENQSDLIDIVHTLRQVINIKG